MCHVRRIYACQHNKAHDVGATLLLRSCQVLQMKTSWPNAADKQVPPVPTALCMCKCMMLCCRLSVVMLVTCKYMLNVDVVLVCCNSCSMWMLCLCVATQPKSGILPQADVCWAFPVLWLSFGGPRRPGKPGPALEACTKDGGNTTALVHEVALVLVSTFYMS